MTELEKQEQNLYVLDGFLKQEFSDERLELEFKGKKFSENDKIFLLRYSIEKEIHKGYSSPSAKEILKDIFKDKFISLKEYEDNNKHVVEARNQLQTQYETYNKKDRIAGFKEFSAFLEWRLSYIKEQKGSICYYCGIDEVTSNNAFKNKKISSKKRTCKNGVLQIERKDPSKGYNKDNCVLACVLCNNAKSDLLKDSEVFKNIFEKPMKKWWEYILKE